MIPAVHGSDLVPADAPAAPDHPVVARLARWLDGLNRLLLGLGMAALVLTALILTYSVVSRYFFRSPTDWQDEAAVFMLVGVTFFCAAHVQARRGHIGIDALAGVLPPAVNAVRRFLVDAVSMAFCAFFSWKSWTLFHEAMRDGYTTNSTLAPPLWIPYGMMALGMSILTAQIFVQVLTHLTNKRSAP